MSMQKFIVYRNPAEAALWESGMLFPIMVGAFVAVVTVVALSFIAEKITSIYHIRKRSHHQFIAGLVYILSALISVLVIWKML